MYQCCQLLRLYTVSDKWSKCMCSVGLLHEYYRGADKSLARPGRKQATVTEDFDVHISYLLS
jgi:hypothetical protein